MRFTLEGASQQMWEVLCPEAHQWTNLLLLVDHLE
jgi:hypothetical protein